MSGKAIVASHFEKAANIINLEAYMRRILLAPFREVTVADFPCRDQRTLFGREIEWVRRCHRSLAECPRPRCMEAIGLGDVLAALEEPQRPRAA